MQEVIITELAVLGDSMGGIFLEIQETYSVILSLPYVVLPLF